MRRALEDGPFSEMQPVDDGRPRKGMRGVRVDVLDPTPRLRVSIRHSDTALDGLLQMIERDRS